MDKLFIEVGEGYCIVRESLYKEKLQKQSRAHSREVRITLISGTLTWHRYSLSNDSGEKIRNCDGIDRFSALIPVTVTVRTWDVGRGTNSSVRYGRNLRDESRH